MTDNITIPRALLEQALEALEKAHHAMQARGGRCRAAGTYLCDVPAQPVGDVLRESPVVRAEAARRLEAVASKMGAFFGGAA